MLRSGLFHTNVKCTYVVVLCFLKITKITEYSTQVIVRGCHIYMLRSELFQTNV